MRSCVHFLFRSTCLEIVVARHTFLSSFLCAPRGVDVEGQGSTRRHGGWCEHHKCVIPCQGEEHIACWGWASWGGAPPVLGQGGYVKILEERFVD